MTARIRWPLMALLAAFAVQNIEEVMFLPSWSIAHIPLASAITSERFALATLIVTALAFAVAGYGYLRQLDLPLSALAGVLLANTLTHIAISLGTASVMPGTLSGLALQGPTSLWLMYRLPLSRAQILGWTGFGFLAGPFFALAALAFSAAILN